MQITFLLGALTLGLTATTALSQTSVRMLKSFDVRYPGSVVICDRFAEMLQSASGGSITVEIFGPETIPPLDQLEPTQNGLFDVLCTYPGFHTGAITLLSGLESIRPDAQAFRESGALETAARAYGALGLQVISLPLTHGIWIYLNEPLSAQGDLAGLQIRALPPQHPYIAALGGTPVVLPPSEMFSALERGVVEGALFPAAGASGYGFAEVTDRFFDIKATAPHVILANQGFWDGLDDATRALFLDEGARLEDEVPATYDRLNAAEADTMRAAGMEELMLAEAVAMRLADALVEGAWGFAASRNPDESATMRTAVEAAGLLSE